jgi:hypothetical protein
MAASDDDSSAVDADDPPGTDADEQSAADEGDATTTPPPPDPQSRAFRRQQFLVGSAGSVLAGIAMTAFLLQTFPGLPLGGAAVGGILAAIFVFWLVDRSIFPGDDDAQT